MTPISYRYFNLSQDTFGAFKFPKVTPIESNVDIFNNHYWRNNKNPGSNYETPSILLTEYTLKFGNTVSSVIRAFQNVSQLTEQGVRDATGLGSNEYLDPYQTLYYGDATGFTYVLPYLIKDGDSIRGTTKNTWTKITGLGGIANDLEKNLKEGGGDISKLVSEAITLGKGVAGGLEGSVSGFGLEEIYKFGDTGRKSIKISFPLYNTFDVKSAFDNLSFVSLFGLQNLKLRTTWLTYLPPKIYKIDGVGIGNLYMPAAYVSSYNITSIGTTRRLDNYGLDGYGGVLVPEAYKVDITFTELVPESTNIMAGSLGGEKVGVISNNNITPPIGPTGSPGNPLTGGNGTSYRIQ